MKSTRAIGTIDEYIDSFPVEIQKRLKQFRETIKKAAPGAEEKISYQMPAFTFHGLLVYFAAHKNHLGFYPFPSAVEAFKEELLPFHCSRGTVQFPHNKPVPVQLVRSIIKFRIAENLAAEKLKSKNKSRLSE